LVRRSAPQRLVPNSSSVDFSPNLDLQALTWAKRANRNNKGRTNCPLALSNYLCFLKGIHRSWEYPQSKGGLGFICQLPVFF
jgi:hypothetical protein